MEPATRLFTNRRDRTHAELMNKRLAMLQKITASPGADAFAWYGLAMEYRNEGCMTEALQTFETLRATFPEYLAQYLMAGQLLIDSQRAREAIPWLEQGVGLAQTQGNSKALGELETALLEAREQCS